MKLLLTVILFSLLLAGCNGQDTKIRQQIVGNWTNSGLGMSFIITSDGSFSSARPSHHNAYEGTWLIKDGVLITTVTNATGTNLTVKAGDVRDFKIVHLDDHQFYFQDRKQAVFYMTR
jgi:hypothetical protein